MADERVKTGEVGFCPHCGEVADVVVPAGDRLQARLLAANARLWSRMPPVPGFSGTGTARVGRTRLAGAIAILGGASENAVKIILKAGYRPLRSSELEALCMCLSDMQAELVEAEEALRELLGEPVDLLRLATECRESTFAGEGGDD